MTTMMVVVMNVLHKEVMVSIGSTSAMLRSELVGFSLFFSFWCFMPKGEKLEGSILFRRHVLQLLELHVVSVES